ncbi:MAG: HAD-IIA family hydrolase [Actinobacteria bacterium]|nr:HAD-IIA family hydrolase [Actinomycetota bacterium]
MTTTRSKALSETEVCASYDAVLLDLDGVVYIGGQPITGVPAALAALRDRGLRLAFVTNNASRTPDEVAHRLRRMDVPADPADVITSAQAAARYTAQRLPTGATVLALGAPALSSALAEQGLIPVASAEASPAAVVQGFSPDLSWRELAEASLAIRAGAQWIACNGDATLPSARGPVPGNGSLVAALVHATTTIPTFVGKPHPAMHRAAIERTQATRPLIIGDRLDTDIAAATAAGCDSMLVLSGITTALQLLTAPPPERPTYLGLTAADLLRPPRSACAEDDGFSCGPWNATAESGRVLLRHREIATDTVSPKDTASPEHSLDALLALCMASWNSPASATPGPDAPVVVASDHHAEAALHRLGIPVAPRTCRGSSQDSRRQPDR